MPMKPVIRKDDEAVLLQLKSPWFPCAYLRRSRVMRNFWAFTPQSSSGAWGRTSIYVQDDFGTLVHSDPNAYLP